MNASVLSLHVGKAQFYGDSSKKEFLERQWYTASFKEASEHPLKVSFEGFLGDEVADRVHHGGRDKAIFANSYENYAHWGEFLALPSLPLGALSENMTVKGLHERGVNLGDIHTIGSAILQVSQPRKPCWKISRRWNNRDFTHEIFSSGLSGWYYKVLQEGVICVGDTIGVEPLKDSISILEANEAFRDPLAFADVLERILEIPSLANSYYESIEKRLSGESHLGYMQTE